MKPHLLVLCLAVWPVAWGHCADLATDAGIDGRDWARPCRWKMRSWINGVGR